MAELAAQEMLTAPLYKEGHTVDRIDRLMWLKELAPMISFLRQAFLVLVASAGIAIVLMMAAMTAQAQRQAPVTPQTSISVPHA